MAAILYQRFVAINAQSFVRRVSERYGLLKAQPDHSIIVIFRATAAIAIAGEEIQISIGTFDDVTQATKLTVEQTFELVYLTRIVGVQHDAI